MYRWTCVPTAVVVQFEKWWTVLWFMFCFFEIFQQIRALPACQDVDYRLDVLVIHPPLK
jgi:hypothetical protein